MKRKMKLAAVSLGLMTATALVAADKVTYQDHILPIFRNKCLKCHNADKMKAALALSNYDAAIMGSGNGPVPVTLEAVSAYDADTLVDVITNTTPGQLTTSASVSPILTFH